MYTDEEQQKLRQLRHRMAEESKAEAESLLVLSGFEKPIRSWQLENLYWPLSPVYDDVRRPWWLLETSEGLIQIGRRKRVLEIRWYEPLGEPVTADAVTKSETHVHAYSSEKAIEYLKSLRNLLLKTRQHLPKKSNYV